MTNAAMRLRKQWRRFQANYAWRLKAYVILFGCVVASLVVYTSYRPDYSDFSAGAEPAYDSFSLIHRSSPRSEWKEFMSASENCPLVVVEPFDKALAHRIARDRRTKKPCRPKEKQRSNISEGRLTISGWRENESCFYRCDGRASPYVRDSVWKDVSREGTLVDCDVFRVECRLSKAITYKGEASTETSDIQKRPDVYMMIIDAASMPQIQRALPKTVAFLKEELNAQLFPFSNKVDEGSCSNGRALFMGWQAPVVSIPRAPPHPAPSLNNERCSPESGNIAAIFKEKGYRTMVSKDYGCGIFYDCQNKTHSVVDHHMNPFFKLLGYLYPETLATDFLGPAGRLHYHPNRWERFCTERHAQIFDHIEQFAAAYPDQPKLSLVWFGYLMHDWRPEIYMYDDDFLHFFQRNKEKFANSHLILTSDHGYRVYWDDVLFYDRKENTNTLMIYKAPEKLSQNPTFTQQIKENARQLVSHYDTYATLRDVAENADEMTADTDFADTPPASAQELIGSSILRPLKQPRNCETLHLHADYCLCRRFSEPKRHVPLATKLAEHAVAFINGLVQEDEEGKKLCAPLRVAEDYLPYLEEYLAPTGNDSWTSYRVTLKTLPGHALYDPIINVDSDGNIEPLKPHLPRRNAYGAQAQCIGRIHWLEMYCFCKSLMNEANEVYKKTGDFLPQ